jgi:hypothetical protein
MPKSLGHPFFLGPDNNPIQRERHFRRIDNTKENSKSDLGHCRIIVATEDLGSEVIKINPLPKGNFLQSDAIDHGSGLLTYDFQCAYRGDYASDSEDAQNKIRERFRRNEATEIRSSFIIIIVCLPGGICLRHAELVYVDCFHINRWRRTLILWGLRIVGALLRSIGMFSGGLPIYWDYDATHGNQKHASHDCTSQKLKHLPCNSYKIIKIRYFTDQAI